MTEKINPRYKKEVIHAVEYHLPNAKIFLFGSRARGTAREGSDIDIALDNKEPIDPHELVRMRFTFENLTMPLMVDVVDLQAAPEELKNRILKEGIVWKG